jgi:hypothetical protein
MLVSTLQFSKEKLRYEGPLHLKEGLFDWLRIFPMFSIQAHASAHCHTSYGGLTECLHQDFMYLNCPALTDSLSNWG